ncbi:MAG: hypothetical protein AAF292_15240 [Pseudomonadota bacterium]
MKHHHIFASLLAIGLVACEPAPEDQPRSVEAAEEAPLTAEQLEIAEQMINAFYSFDPELLSPFLTEVGDEGSRLLWYQGWAEGGNYKIVSRAPCALGEADKINCPITVEDDPVLALGSDFKVTDTFTISFDGTTIVSVETSSNDQPIYYQASAWVRENLPEVMEGPCKGFFADGETPGDCARAMADGYAQFAASEDFPE